MSATETTTETAAPSAVRTRLNYYLEPANGGTTVTYPGTAGDKLRAHDSHEVTITDIRSCKSRASLDSHGFQLVAHTAAEKSFVEDPQIEAGYYEEVKELLKNTTGATRVHPFSHLIRRQPWAEAVQAARGKDGTEVVRTQNPAMFIHVDQSYIGAEMILRDNMAPEETAKLRETRWGIINVWRPIERKVTREPLAVCDARSVRESDLRPVMGFLPAKGQNGLGNVSHGETVELWNVAYSPCHKWYYASEMTPDEVLMIKCFDSKLDGRARRSPHSAFQSDNDHGPARQSIEVRCLVFWEDQEVE